VRWTDVEGGVRSGRKCIMVVVVGWKVEVVARTGRFLPVLARNKNPPLRMWEKPRKPYDTRH
jgi:hypothetical protein